MNSDSPILDLNCGADTERPMSDGENKSDNDDKLHIDVKDDEGVEGPSSSSTHHLGEHIMADGDVKEDSDEVEIFFFIFPLINILHFAGLNYLSIHITTYIPYKHLQTKKVKLQIK